jgi:hypothetical protein
MSPHSSRAAVRRLAITLAGGALAAAVVVTPAAAHSDPRDDPGTAGQSAANGRDNGQNSNQNNGRDNGQNNGRDDSRRDDPRRYRGVVTASKLALRSAPNRGSRVIRYARRGEVVSIYCKTPGDSVEGNRLWYLLTDGTWAWGAARYIDNIGPAPRWC